MTKTVNCPTCGLHWSLFPPVRFDEVVPGQYPQKFRPGPSVRCIECKDEFMLPIAIGYYGEAVERENSAQIVHDAKRILR